MITINQNDSIPVDAKLIHENIDGSKDIYFDGDSEVTDIASQSSRAEAVKERHNQKAERDKSVAKLYATVNGYTFDADELSQDRIARTIQTLAANESINWVMADNTIKTVTVEDLKDALKEAVNQTTELFTAQ